MVCDILEERVSLVMSSPPITVSEDSDLEYTARVMYENRVGSVLVVSRGVLKGIVTRTDIVYMVASGIARRNPKVKDVMTTSLITARPDEPLYRVMDKMRELGIRHIPIVDDDQKPLGVITMTDILKHIAEKTPCTQGKEK